MIELRYPGKLFILGEYAIMESGSKAILVSVNRYLEAKLIQSDFLHIESEYGILTEHTQDKKMNYVKAALEVAKELLNYHKVSFKNFHLSLSSQLNDANNRKYGFGSSGVVIVATLDSILKYHNIELSKLELFKLSVLTQSRMNLLSSGADLATSIYQGFICYTRYNINSIQKDVSCIYEPWKDLRIQELNWDIHIAVGYTNKSHDTNKALQSFKLLKKQQPQIYHEMISKAQVIVKSALDSNLNMAMNQYRDWMLELQNQLSYTIETETLSNLIESAKSLGLSAKVSGSGGGDCGIALYNNKESLSLLKEAWIKQGIQYIEGAII